MIKLPFAALVCVLFFLMYLDRGWIASRPQSVQPQESTWAENPYNTEHVCEMTLRFHIAE